MQPACKLTFGLSHTLWFKAQEDDDGKNTDDITFSSTQSGPAWAGSERDYTYDEVQSKSGSRENFYDFRGILHPSYYQLNIFIRDLRCRTRHLVIMTLKKGMVSHIFI